MFWSGFQWTRSDGYVAELSDDSSPSLHNGNSLSGCPRGLGTGAGRVSTPLCVHTFYEYLFQILSRQVDLSTFYKLNSFLWRDFDLKIYLREKITPIRISKIKLTVVSNANLKFLESNLST